MDDAFLRRVRDELHKRYAIEHTTLQLERGGECSQASSEVV
jgi:Co/Zn/Cd efflux system component